MRFSVNVAKKVVAYILSTCCAIFITKKGDLSL